MFKKTRPLRENSGSVFNKSFFSFLSGFFSLIFFGLVSVFIAGYYKVEAVGDSEGLEAKTSTKQMAVDKIYNSSSAAKSLESASSTNQR